MGVVGVWVNTKIYQRNTTRLQAHTQIIMCKQKEEKKAGNIASSVCDISDCAKLLSALFMRRIKKALIKTYSH